MTKNTSAHIAGIIIVLAGFSVASLAENEFPGIEKLMSEEEFKEAGLEKLTDAERDSLDSWLVRYTANDAITHKETKEVKAVANEDIAAQIDGEFNGWDGKTIFKMKNGQVWQQRLAGRWKTQLQDPKVTITKNFFGFYVMKVEGSNKAIGVKRVR